MRQGKAGRKLLQNYFKGNIMSLKGMENAPLRDEIAYQFQGEVFAN